jgi:ABC-type transport system involved in cytochrome c biogenesis permease subunit
MLTFVDRIAVQCFAASYAVAFALELWHLLRPRPILRLLSLGFGAAGLCAHIGYLSTKALPIGSSIGSLYFLALILAVFYLYGALHHKRIAWGLFVLPLVLVLIGLGLLSPEADGSVETSLGWKNFWGVTHGTLLLLSAVGVCVGFIASIMYLVQMRRLQAKLPPNKGIPLLSLERLEQMNKRAILWAFPLLTAGLLAGFALQIREGIFLQGWDTPRIASVLGLWIVFAILLYLRYRVHLRGRQLAFLTMIAFAILVCMLISQPHSFVTGDQP